MGIGRSSLYQDVRQLNVIDVVTSSGKHRENLLIDDSTFWESEGTFPHSIQIILPSDVILCQIALLCGNDRVKTPKNIKTALDTCTRSVEIMQQSFLNWITVWNADSKIVKSTNPIIEILDCHGGEVVRLCGIRVLGYSAHHSGYIDTLRNRIPFPSNQSIMDQVLNMRAIVAAGADLELLFKNKMIKATVNADFIEIFSSQGHVFVESESALCQKSSIFQLTWSFVVSGQSDWCCGLISDVGEDILPTSFSSIGLTSFSSTLFRLPVCAMHEKLVSITVDSILNVATFYVDGLLEKRFRIPATLFPLRIGFYGVHGSKITLLRSVDAAEVNSRESQGNKDLQRVPRNIIHMSSVFPVSMKGLKVSHKITLSAIHSRSG